MKTLKSPPPLTPAATLPLPYVPMFTQAQNRKIADLSARIAERARKPYARFIELAKRALSYGERERALSEKLIALLTMNDYSR